MRVVLPSAKKAGDDRCRDFGKMTHEQAPGSCAVGGRLMGGAGRTRRPSPAAGKRTGIDE